MFKTLTIDISSAGKIASPWLMSTGVCSWFTQAEGSLLRRRRVGLIQNHHKHANLLKFMEVTDSDLLFQNFLLILEELKSDDSAAQTRIIVHAGEEAPGRE